MIKAEQIINVRNELEKAIIPEMAWIADELNKVGFLSSGTYEDIKSSHSMLRETQMACALVGDVHRRAQLDLNAMEVFVGILKKKPLQLQPAIDLLKDLRVSKLSCTFSEGVRVSDNLS